ncbi:MAG: peptidylprolyl isomerase [Candidatus Schekmanbacteria bacterium]|nr:peptidylprolyl isomerase [Candidatus Schekmanbacteria bacterium]
MRRGRDIARAGIFALCLAAGAGSAADPEEKTNPLVVIETTRGRITVELLAAQAPQTVASFLRYVDEKFYDGTVFHRVLPGSIVQAGGFTAKLEEKPTHESIPCESRPGVGNNKGTLAMARGADPDSATSQFFINLRANAHLNFKRPTRDGRGYTVFGRVLEGMDVVAAIGSMTTRTVGELRDVPEELVEIRSMRRAAP